MLMQGGHDHSIASRPAHPLDLALKNLNLAPERQHLSLERGSIAAAGCEHVHQGPNQRIDKRSHHAGAKS
jgi:hypothetical protein